MLYSLLLTVEALMLALRRLLSSGLRRIGNNTSSGYRGSYYTNLSYNRGGLLLGVDIGVVASHWGQRGLSHVASSGVSVDLS